MSTKNATGKTTDATANIKLIRLPSDLFNLVADHTTLGDNTRRMAREVLVNGRKITEVAADFATAKQNVSRSVENVRSEFNRLMSDNPLLMTETDPAFFEITVTAPYPLAVEFINFCNSMRKRSGNYSTRGRGDAITQVLLALETANG